MGITIGLLNVRRSILIQAPPERVWQEFGGFERIAAWFGQGHDLHQFEAKLGGQVQLSVVIDGDRRYFGGRVVVFEPQREVSFESNWEGPHAWPVPTFFTLRLTPVYESTMVEILHHGFERFGADAADNLEGYEDGWDVKHLKSLRAIVEQ
jgi:uncharacterized protein YndB with AHSA1/START domain